MFVLMQCDIDWYDDDFVGRYFDSDEIAVMRRAVEFATSRFPANPQAQLMIMRDAWEENLDRPYPQKKFEKMAMDWIVSQAQAK